jgi:hypothetical protein
LKSRFPVRPNDHTVARRHSLGPGLGQVLQHSHEHIVAHDLSRRVVDLCLVEEERGGCLHPGGRKHILPDDDLSRALLGLVAPSSETLDWDHVQEAGVDLQVPRTPEDTPEVVEDPVRVPQLGEDLQGEVPHHIGGGRVEVLPVVEDPVLRREVHYGCW